MWWFVKGSALSLLLCMVCGFDIVQSFGKKNCGLQCFRSEQNKSLISYFCSWFKTSESSLLRRLFRPLHLCVSLLLLNRKVFTSNFFDMDGVGVENMKDIQSNKCEYLQKYNDIFQNS